MIHEIQTIFTHFFQSPKFAHVKGVQKTGKQINRQQWTRAEVQEEV